MPSIADVVAHVLAADLPVLFPDTCILLDVIRGTKRRIKDCAARARNCTRWRPRRQSGAPSSWGPWLRSNGTRGPRRSWTT